MLHVQNLRLSGIARGLSPTYGTSALHPRLAAQALAQRAGALSTAKRAEPGPRPASLYKDVATGFLRNFFGRDPGSAKNGCAIFLARERKRGEGSANPSTRVPGSCGPDEFSLYLARSSAAIRDLHLSRVSHNGTR